MNRKMRAKLNNQQAKVKKERKRCSQEGQYVASESPTCDECGAKLEPVVAALVVEIILSVPKEKLH